MHQIHLENDSGIALVDEWIIYQERKEKERAVVRRTQLCSRIQPLPISTALMIPSSLPNDLPLPCSITSQLQIDPSIESKYVDAVEFSSIIRGTCLSYLRIGGALDPQKDKSSKVSSRMKYSTLLLMIHQPLIKLKHLLTMQLHTLILILECTMESTLVPT